MPNPGNILYPPSGTAQIAVKAARPVAFPVLSNPFPGRNEALVLRQEFECWGNSWTPLDLDTPYNSAGNFAGAEDWVDWSDFILVEESERQPIGGGFVRWTRAFAVVPDNSITAPFGVACAHFDQISYGYNFPGYNAVGNVRDPFPDTVPGIKVYEYFLLASGDQVAAVSPQIFYLKVDPTGANKNNLVTVLTGAATANETVPTFETWRSWINAGTPIVPQASLPFRWMGNIWGRETIYILPQ